MNLAVIISGLVFGLMYAAAGMGLVIIYRANRVINFALGGCGAVSGYMTYALVGRDLNFWLAGAVSVLAGACVGALLYLMLAPLLKQDHLKVAVGTLGALICIQGIVGTVASFETVTVNAPLTGAGHAWVVAGASISRYTLVASTVSVLSIIGLYLLVYRTSLGLKMRAASAGPLTAQLMGINVERIRLIAWTLGGAYGAIAAVLIIPLTHLSPFSFTSVTIIAFAAIVIGGFGSLIGAVVGGMSLGLATAMVSYSLTPRLATTYVFLAVALMLLIKPYGLFGRAEREMSEPDL